MTNDKILEIARRYTVPKEESSILVEFNEHDVPTPTGETLNLVMWNFCEEELLAFAQSVIEAERDTTKQLAAYKTLVGSFEKQITAYRQRLKELEGAEASLDSERECNARLTKELEAQESSDEPVAWLTLGKDMGSDRDNVTFSKSPLIPSIPLYTRPAPARKPLSEDEIEEIRREFPSRIDLFVRAIEKAHGIGEVE